MQQTREYARPTHGWMAERTLRGSRPLQNLHEPEGAGHVPAELAGQDEGAGEQRGYERMRERQRENATRE